MMMMMMMTTMGAFHHQQGGAGEERGMEEGLGTNNTNNNSSGNKNLELHHHLVQQAQAQAQAATTEKVGRQTVRCVVLHDLHRIEALLDRVTANTTLAHCRLVALLQRRLHRARGTATCC
jgi:hypothetical protein